MNWKRDKNLEGGTTLRYWENNEEESIKIRVYNTGIMKKFNVYFCSRLALKTDTLEQAKEVVENIKDLREEHSADEIIDWLENIETSRKTFTQGLIWR